MEVVATREVCLGYSAASLGETPLRDTHDGTQKASGVGIRGV
jgi:hypothetical protein